jgi:hypothetical protein
MVLGKGDAVTTNRIVTRGGSRVRVRECVYRIRARAKAGDGVVG